MKNIYLLSTLLLLLTLSHSLPNLFYDNIIIGAGIAGIGASMVLSNNSARHLLIQARNRIGGRITSFPFAGTLQELGASFIQLPKQNNLVDPFVTTFNIPKIPANFDTQTAWYVNKSTCSANDLSKAEVVFNSLLNYIYKQSYILSSDQPVSNILSQFWIKNPQYSGFVKDRVNQQMQVEAVDNGAQLYNMSTYQFSGGNDGQDAYDYEPLGGYTSLISRMFKTYCRPILQLNQKLLKVDYSGPTIVVTTSLGIYTTNKLFIALPLGILKAGQIQFQPPLPAGKAQAISSIGNGYYQKLFVTFSAAFWPASAVNGGTLHFIGKDNPSRYVQAWVVPEPTSNGLNMLIFWISGDLARQITTWTFDQVKADLLANLGNYIPQTVTITNLYLTNWENDPYTLGGFSYAKVGTTNRNFVNMKSVLKYSQNRIWFIGEYVDPDEYSFSHGAFKTGVQAAKQSLRH